MEYIVHCECGESHSVTASQAGGSLLCRCGREVAVPRLSELRLSAGQTAHRLSVAEKIHGMITRSELPGEMLCTECGATTYQVAWFRVQCETAWSSEPGNQDGIAVAMFGWIAALASMLSPRRGYQSPEIHGREVVVDAPIAWCGNCLGPNEQNVSDRSARRQLKMVPIYAELFQEYPRASVELMKIVADTRP